LDSLTLHKMIDYAETAIRWANEVGSDWAEQEQVRAAVAMYVGQVGEIINHEIPLDEQVANYELFGELGGFRNGGGVRPLVERDLTYIDRWSLMLDLKILLRTVPAVIGRTGK
jgi:hypothetical protein